MEPTPFILTRGEERFPFYVRQTIFSAISPEEDCLVGWVPRTWSGTGQELGSWSLEYESLGREIEVIESLPESGGLRLVLKRLPVAFTSPPSFRVVQPVGVA